MFIFDPNDPKAAVDHWMEQVGDLYRGQKYNGFLLFNDDRELLDLFITDSEGRWLVDDVDLQSMPNRGWDYLIQRCKAVNANNVIGIHTHKADEPDGPCGDLGDFCSSAVKYLDEQNIQFRGILLLHDDQLEGVVTVTSLDQHQLSQHKLDQGKQILADLREAAKTDPSIAKVVPLLEQVIDAVERGEEPDQDLLNATMRATAEGIINHLSEPEPPINPLRLPQLDARKDLLN